MDRWTQYLYERHSESELRDWVSRLNMFRYFRAYGGHANDGDSLDVAYRYESTEGLISLLNRLGLEPEVFDQKPEQAVPGTRYTHEEYNSFPSLVQNTEWIKQPRHCEIFGIKVFVWCGIGLITISASPGSCDVTNIHVDAAEELERNLVDISQLIVDPPKDTKHYICPRYHPNIFS